MTLEHIDETIGRRRLSSLALALLGCLAAALFTGAATSDPAKAGPQVLCPVDELPVPESAGTGVTSEWLSPGQTLGVTPLADRIWAGVWFTGTNGPEGWTHTRAASFYPLPGVPEYSLIARIGSGPWQYVGNTSRTFTNNTSGLLQRVRFRVNDNAPGNGSGAFKVFLRYPCHS
jgi:hypothetical protein